MERLSFDEHIRRLRRRLQVPLPGPAAQLTMAPATRQDHSQLEVRGKACREAAVLAVLFPLEGTPAVILTVRPGHLSHHAGQVAFPGGRREPDEPLLETALREAQEEVNLAPDAVEVLGPLTPLYIPPSNYCVYPFVAAAPAPPRLRAQDAEVAAILEVPIAHLLDPSMRLREAWTLRGQTVEVPFFQVSQYKIWGATAMMLAELLALFTAAEAEVPRPGGD